MTTQNITKPVCHKCRCRAARRWHITTVYSDIPDLHRCPEPQDIEITKKGIKESTERNFCLNNSKKTKNLASKKYQVIPMNLQPANHKGQITNDIGTNVTFTCEPSQSYLTLCDLSPHAIMGESFNNFTITHLETEILQTLSQNLYATQISLLRKQLHQ
jgi:hypothetical protein